MFDDLARIVCLDLQLVPLDGDIHSLTAVLSLTRRCVDCVLSHKTARLRSTTR